MRRYQKITVDEKVQLLGWYGSLSHTGEREMDFDVLSDYSIVIDGDVCCVTHLPTNNNYLHSSVDDACESLLGKVNKQAELWAFVNGKTEEFGVVVDRNSLEQRYADKIVERKEKTPEQLKQKYATYERKSKLFEKHRAKISAKLNAGYHDRLLNH